MTDVDLVNRDPNNIKDHLQCNFEDVIAEPDGTHSIDCVWKFAHISFTCWKSCCYKLCTLLNGPSIAAEWGCIFAYLSFMHIWYYTPMLKYIQITCSFSKRVYHIIVGCCLEPCCMACGMLFHQFKKS